MTIVSRGANNDWQYEIFKDASDQLVCKVHQSNSGAGYLETIATITVNDNNWHHGTCVISGTSLYAYVDGNLVESDTTPTGTRDTASAGELRMGTFDFGGGFYFDGQIDDVRIYNYALTQQQIDEVYSGGAVRFE
jgi:hypothetical protein